MTPTGLAIALAVPFVLLHAWILRVPTARGARGLLWAVFVLKLAVALTMGHYDVHRFIVFIQRFVAEPRLNPWDAGLTHPDADFPYPPLLLYLHAAPFFIFKPLLNLSAPFEPNGFGYALIRIPLLIADLIFLRFGLLGRGPASSPSTRPWILLSPVLLFHQYYSGQLDWIAVIPFYFAATRWERRGWDAGTLAALALSLMLKPFAVLFLPFWPLLGARRDLWKTLGACAVAFAIFKLSELPYGLTASYRQLVGAGAAQLLLPAPGFSFALFPWLYGAAWLAAAAVARTGRRPDWAWVVTTVSFALAAGCQPSAGWMAWMVPFAPTVFAKGGLRWRVLLGLWGGLFVARWSLVSHSPVLDSFDVFLRFHWGSLKRFGMGAPYRWLASHLGFGIADRAVLFSAVALACCSLALWAQCLRRTMTLADPGAPDVC